MEKEPYKVAKELLEKYEPTHPTLSRTMTPQDNDNSSGKGTERGKRREGGREEWRSLRYHCFNDNRL